MPWKKGANVPVTLVGLIDETNQTLVTNATVTTRLQTLSGAPSAYPNGGVDVAGVAWPLILASIGGGSYRGICPSTVQVNVGQTYQLYTVATDGTTTAPFVDYITITQ